jgi:hypothetical protein
MRFGRAVSALLLAAGVILLIRSFILVNEEMTITPDSPVVISSPAVMRFWGKVETDSMRMGFRIVNDSSYAGGAPLINVRWTRNVSFDVENGGWERIHFIVSNTNVDPAIEISVRLRSYGLAPLSPWFLLGLGAIITGATALIKKRSGS